MKNMMKTATGYILTNNMRKKYLNNNIRHFLSNYKGLAALSAILVLATSCFSDRDSFANHDPDHVVAVEGISTEVYTLYMGDRFECQPEVELSSGCDEKDYEYRWLIGKSEVISTEKNLDWEVSLPEGYSINKNIPGVYVIRNKVNDLEYRKTFTIKVLNGYTPNYVALYETSDHNIEWMSLQGTPAAFTRTFDNMVERLGEGKTIKGRYIGSFNSTNELAVFTDNAPDFGYCINMTDADPDNDIYNNIGELIAPIKGRVYLGNDNNLDIKDVTFGYGASKYLINNGTLHVFNGLEKKLPMFDSQTFVKSENVSQTISSKNFMRYKKVSFVRHNDNTIGCFHVYNDVMENVMVEGKPLKLDYLCGEFSEATGLGSNKPYHAYLIAKSGNDYNMYVFYVNYIGTKVQPIVLKQIIPLPEWVKDVKYWFGAFGESYGFYVINNAIYKFDYYEMTEFTPASKPMISFPAEYEILDLYVQIADLGLRDEDYCTVVYLYNRAKDKTTLYVYNTVTGKKLNEYPDLLPGKGLCFINRKM